MRADTVNGEGFFPSGVTFFICTLRADTSNDTGLPGVALSSKLIAPPSSSNSLITTAQGWDGLPDLAAGAGTALSALALLLPLSQASNIQRLSSPRLTVTLGCVIAILPTVTLCLPRSTSAWATSSFLMEASAAAFLPCPPLCCNPRSFRVSCFTSSKTSGAFQFTPISAFRLPPSAGSRKPAR